jgi:hypothetical protein
MMDNSPPNYPSSRPSSVVGLQTSQHINGLDSQEQSMTLPVLTANLQLDSGPPNSTTSLIPAAITARDYSSEYMLQLRRFLQPKGVLEENGYILQDLSESEIERKKKCKRCGKGKYVTDRGPYRLVTNGYSNTKR